MNRAKSDMPYIFTSVLTVVNRIICGTKPIDATFLRRSLALAEKIWNETNLQDVAQDWIL